MLDVKRSKVTKPISSQAATKSSKSKISRHHKSSPSLDKALETSLSTTPSQTSTSTKPTKHNPSSKMTAPTTPQQPLTQLLKPLASSTPSLRRNALNQLLARLRSADSAPLTKTEALQIHRALYVALYMHDSKSAVSVQNLARTIAGTVRVMMERDLRRWREGGGEEDGEFFVESATWTTAFWEEIAREWVGVDQWRMNKVLMLVRFWVGDGVGVLRELAGLGGADEDDAKEEEARSAVEDVASRDPQAWKTYLADIVALPLEATRSLPDGLRIHVLDVWGDEVEALAAISSDDGDEDEEKKRKEVMKALLVPVKELSVFHEGSEVPNMPKNVRVRAKEVLKRAEA